MENVLASLAYLDAVHDFGDYAEIYKHDLEPSIPRSSSELPTFKDEDVALADAMKYAQTMRKLEFRTPDDIFRLLGGDKTHPIAIVCDASFCSGFVNILKHNTIGHVYFIINRETINDSGKNMIPDENGTLFIATDIHDKAIKYPRFTFNNILNDTHLHSTLDLELLYTNNEFICKTYFNNTEIEKIEKSIDNSISSTIETIVLTNNVLIRQSAFLRKRSGDWLQVLSCMDKERLYNINREVKNLTDCNIYFCSSDRVAIAFALYNDISCILKQKSGYSYYTSKRVHNIMMSERMKQFYIYQHDANKYIPLLKMGIQSYRSIKEKWTKELETITSVTSLSEIKTLIYLAFHFESLSSFYGKDSDMETIEAFIANPYDPIFNNSLTAGTVSRAIEWFERSNRRFKDLRTDEVIEEDNYRYFSLFDLSNVSHESYDLIYGASLFKILLRKSEPVLKHFAVEAMNKVIELLDYDEHVVAMYSLLIESCDDSMNQRGGGVGKYNPTKQSLIAAGEYLTKWLLMRHRLIKPIPTFKFALRIEIPGSGGWLIGSLNIHLIEHLIYKHNIIPKEFIKFVDYENSLYREEEESPMYEMAQFLKRLQQPVYPRRQTTRRLNKVLVSAHRRRKSRHSRRHF